MIRSVPDDHRNAERPASSWVPPDVDTTRPSAARVYDAYLGGSHNFAVDREFAQQAEVLLPHVADVARWNRTFLRRAVRYAAESEGIAQFLDIGCGLPVSGAVHEIAGAHAQTVYADNEPIAVAQAEMALDGDERAHVVHGDVRIPETILPAAQELLDFERPVCVLVVALLHFLPDSEQPAELVARFRDALPPGSLVAISHATVDGVPEPVRSQTLNFINSYEDTQNPGFVARDRTEFAALFTGLDLVEPGITYTPEWRPDVPVTADQHPERAVCWAAVGRKVDRT